MSHRKVLRKTSIITKLRVAFDASSHVPGCIALDECLEAVLNLNSELLEILIRFIWHPVALIGDIEKASLQIEIRV